MNIEVYHSPKEGSYLIYLKVVQQDEWLHISAEKIVEFISKIINKTE